MRKNNAGFTLLEVLIALFIFTIVATMLTTALHRVIVLQSGAEQAGERLRQLQITLLIFSRDVEQAVARPVLDTAGKEESAFIGGPHDFVFTHGGHANPEGIQLQSSLQRTRYSGSKGIFSRTTWAVLDQAPSSQPHTRELLKDVKEVRFEYFNQQGRAYSQWPYLGGGADEPLPKAIRLYLTFSNGEKMSQLYVLPLKTTNTNVPASSPLS